MFDPVNSRRHRRDLLSGAVFTGLGVSVLWLSGLFAADKRNPRLTYAFYKMDSLRFIVLPDGSEIDMARYAKRPKVNKEYLRLQFDTGEVFAVLSKEGGTLHGASYTQYKTRMQRSFIHYRKGVRDGPVSVFNEKGEFLYVGEFKRGRKTGRSALFDDGQLLLVEELDGNHVKARHRYENHFLAKSYKGDNFDAALSAVVDRMEKLEATLRANELDLKKLVRQAHQNERTMKARRRAGAKLVDANRIERKERQHKVIDEIIRRGY